MDSDTFNVLLPDGAVKLSFAPPLSPGDYEHLLRLVQTVSGARELQESLRQHAPAWGIDEFRIDPA